MHKNILVSCGFLAAIITTILSTGCGSTKIPASAYINNDSTSVYSTHASRPFKYGFAYSKAMCELYFKDVVQEFGIKNGDVIADVGAASGWVEGALSVFTDSVTYYIQDTNSVFLNPAQFNSVIDHYTKVRTSPQTNIFHYVIGTTTKTNLPDTTFDKIIINNAYHEFTNPYTIINDLYSKLKPGGKLIIYETFSNDFMKVRHKGCKIKADRASQVVKWLRLSDFYLTKMNYPDNSLSNYLTFETDQKVENEFVKKRSSVKKYIDELDKLNQEIIYNDSTTTAIYGNYLKENLTNIQSVYPTIEEYINALGYQLIEQKKFPAAINIFKINSLLYPASALVYGSLGEAFMKNKQYESAILNYEKSLELNPGNENAKDQLKKIKEEQGKPQ